jgi:hypothetical protein
MIRTPYRAAPVQAASRAYSAAWLDPEPIPVEPARLVTHDRAGVADPLVEPTDDHEVGALARRIVPQSAPSP